MGETTVQPYSVGICYASACAPWDATPEEIEQAVNLKHPTGLAHGWRISDEPTFSGGEPNPCDCNDNPDRRHWLLSC